MAMPALKSLEDVYDLLNQRHEEKRRLSPLERYYIADRAKELIDKIPASAYLIYGLISITDHDETNMRKNFSQALFYEPNNPLVNYNYAIGLHDFKYTDEMYMYLNRVLDNIESAPGLIDELALFALRIGNADIIFRTLKIANKLNLSSANIAVLATHVALANADSPEEEAEILENILSDKELREKSEELTDTEWKRMQEFAETLKLHM